MKTMTCTKCLDKQELVWLRRGQARQTGNGFLVSKISGYYCPQCAASFGGTRARPAVKTKLVCLILAASLATAPAPQPKIESFIEGLCAGLVIGTAIGTVVIVGVNCWKKHHPGPPPEPPPPAWCYTNTLPTVTNSPPWTNHATINASNSVSWYSAADASYEMFDTTVETRTLDQTNWTALYLVRGWKTQSNTVARLTAPDGTPIVTNWTAEHEPFLLTLPAPLPTNSLFRTVSQ